MAIDSRAKRQSASSLLLPFLPPGIDPSGTINTATRQAAAWVYSGILSGLLSIAVFVASYRRRREL